jgi:hypothetical protein
VAHPGQQQFIPHLLLPSALSGKEKPLDTGWNHMIQTQKDYRLFSFWIFCCCCYLFAYLFAFVVLWIELRASHKQGKHCITDLHLTFVLF